MYIAWVHTFFYTSDGYKVNRIKNCERSSMGGNTWINKNGTKSWEPTPYHHHKNRWEAYRSLMSWKVTGEEEDKHEYQTHIKECIKPNCEGDFNCISHMLDRRSAIYRREWYEQKENLERYWKEDKKLKFNKKTILWKEEWMYKGEEEW